MELALVVEHANVMLDSVVAIVGHARSITLDTLNAIVSFDIIFQL